MLGYMKAGIHNWEDEDEVARFLKRIMLKKEGDGTGLIYGMGHAVYTKSDPSALILRQNAMKLAQGTEFEAEFKLLNLVEKLTPQVFCRGQRGLQEFCANVDLYSGLVYRMLENPRGPVYPVICLLPHGWLERAPDRRNV